MDLSGLLATLVPVHRSTSVFEPVSPGAESIRYLFYFVFAVCGVIFLLVEGVLLYSLFRFRRPRPDGREPPQVYGSKPIEIAWTAAPAIIVFLLVLVVIRTELEVRADPNQPPPNSQPLRVTVVGRQWWWEYRYEEYDGKALTFITANELHVPASDEGKRRPVYLTLKSADVCHSWWVPRLAGKTDLIPGRTNSMWFETQQSGLYLGQCAEFCGTQHANMLLRVVVEPDSEFRKWLTHQQSHAVEDPTASEGRNLFLAQSCINCHRVRGTKAAGTYAPDLTHLMSRQTLASGIIENNRKELRRWLVNPQESKPGCLMPAFGLSPREFDLLTDYLLTLK